MARSLHRVGIRALGTLAVIAASASAQETIETPEIISALVEGKVSLDMRFRWENAKIAGFKGSNAVTLRTRLGYGTKSYHGFMAYAGFENIVALKNNTYFDAIAPNTDSRTAIADPEATEVDQAYLKWSSDALGGDSAFANSGTALLGGRTKLVLDDARFIGNMGWRQNQQTYDVGLIRSSFGHDSLATTYAYLFGINRIFGDAGAPGGWHAGLRF